MNFGARRKFKTAKNAIHEKNFLGLFDFTSFFAWTIFNFPAHCRRPGSGFARNPDFGSAVEKWV